MNRRTGLVKILEYLVVHDCGRELNPLEDALAHLGVVVRSLPITPEQVWRWLQ